MGSLRNGQYNNSSGDQINKLNASANHEFPPGCGPNLSYISRPESTQPIAPSIEKLNLGGNKNTTSGAASECGNTSELVNISVLQQLVKNLVQSELTDSLEHLVGKVVTETCKANGIDLSSILEPKPLNTVTIKSSEEVSIIEYPTGVYESKTISDNGSSSNWISSEAIGKRYNPNEGQSTIFEIDSLRKGNISDKISTEIKKKSLLENIFPRRVSAVREYPPFCGRNAPCPTDEERKMLTSENKGKIKETNTFTARDSLLKRRNLEELPKPLKKTTRPTDLGKNPIKEIAAAATKNNSITQKNSSDLLKGLKNAETSNRDRVKVKEALALFRYICEEISEKEKAKAEKGEKKIRRIDLEAAKMMREKRKGVNMEIQRIGSVPGVEVGDEFLYRAELTIVGIHRLPQGGIDYIKHGSIILATSIIAAEGYSDELNHSDILVYSGQGGFMNDKKNRPPEDQKLEKGNLALKNCISAKTPVRVTRGFKKGDIYGNNRVSVVTYTYDGLYTVEKYWSEKGQHGKLVFMFELKRIHGQPRVAWKRSDVKIKKWP